MDPATRAKLKAAIRRHELASLLSPRPQGILQTNPRPVPRAPLTPEQAARAFLERGRRG